MSGTAFSYFARCKENNHVKLLYNIFQEELGNQSSSKEILKFMKNAPVELIVQKTPVIEVVNGLLTLYWGPVFESVYKF